MRILYIAPGDNPHTWKWVGWFGRKYPGEIGLIPYEAPVPEGKLPGVEIIGKVIPIFRIGSLDSWMKVGAVKSIVRKFKPSLLHALWAYGSGTYGARSGHHPFLLSPWGTDITVYPSRSGFKGSIQRRLVLEALRKADKITATSRYLADAIHGLVPDRDMPDLFPYGVDTSVFDPNTVKDSLEFPWPDGAPSGPGALTVGFFKSLEHTYGPDILIQAIAVAAKELRQVRCVIAGSGELLEKLKRLAETLGVEKRICFPGRIPHEKMPAALKGIDIFAMPSRYEVFGVAALEASAMGKPVIASKKWGIVEVVEDGVTGILVVLDSAEVLAEQIVRLGRDPAARARMGAAGREFVKGNFEFEEIMQRADRYCAELIESHKP